VRPAKVARVLMTADTLGGVWTYAVDLTRALGESGVEVVLATMGGTVSRAQLAEIRGIKNVELVESTYRLPWMDQPWDDVDSAGEWLLDLASQVDPDVIHLNEPVYGSLAWSVPSVAVTHSCVLSWWESVWHTLPPPEWDHYRQAMRRGLLAADEIVAPSAWMLESVRRHYGVRTGRVVPNGRNGRELTPEVKTPVVFAAGRLWDEAKNLLALDHVADGLAWPVYIAGDPEHPARRERVSTRHCRLLGRLPPRAIATWLRQAGIYAFPAKYEPFGLSVLEAALSGCALVLSDIPTLRELWDGAAVFVGPEEHATIRLALEALIEDAGLRQALALRARRRALGLTPQRMARAYLDLYGDLVAKHPTALEGQACAS
jgi:glycogen(starch) synthase